MNLVALRAAGIAGIVGAICWAIGDVLLVGGSAPAEQFPLLLRDYADRIPFKALAWMLPLDESRLAAGAMIGLEDAIVLANRMVTGGERACDTARMAGELGWEPRRTNSAICYLERAGAIKSRTALASAPWRAVQLIRTDDTLRFARNHA